MNQRERQKDSRRKQIQETSLDLFVRHGFTGTSTREISRKIGISSGLMFHYYETKEQLYIAHLETALDGIHMMEEFLQMPIPPLQAFRQLADAVLSYFAVSPMTAKVFLLAKQAMYADYLTDKMKAVIGQMDIIEKMIPVIQDGQQDGDIKHGNPRTLALCFFSAIESVAETVVCFPDVPMPEGEWLADILRV